MGHCLLSKLLQPHQHQESGLEEALWTLQNKGPLALIKICRARLAANRGPTQCRRRQVLHGPFLESDSCHLPLHRNRPGLGPGEKHASNTKQQLLHRGTQVYRKQDVSICSVLAVGTSHHLGSHRQGCVPAYNHPIPAGEAACNFSRKCLEGSVNSDTGIRMGLWELLWGYLSPSSCLLCVDYLPPIA